MATKTTTKQTRQGQFFFHEWILPLIFLFTLPPVGLVLFLLFFFFRGTIEQKKAGKKQTDIRPVGSRITVSRETRAAVMSAPFDPTASTLSKVKKLSILGAVMAIIFALAFALLLADSIKNELTGMDLINQVITPLCYSIAGLLMWLDAGLKKKQVQRYRRYLSVMDRHHTVTIDQLSSASGRPSQLVRKDLLEMVEKGLFLEGYMDCGGDKLLLPPA